MTGAPSIDNADFGITRTGMVEITVVDGDTGEIRSQETVKNLFTTYGKNWVADEVGISGSAEEATFISVGTGGCDATETTLDTEYDSTSDTGFDRNDAISELADTGDGTWSIWSIWTANNTQNDINITGLYHDLAGATMIACVNFTAANVEANDQLTINWSNTVS